MVAQWFKMSDPKKHDLGENFLSRVAVDQSEVEFELKQLPKQMSKSQLRPQHCKYSKRLHFVVLNQITSIFGGRLTFDPFCMRDSLTVNSRVLERTRGETSRVN